MNGPLSRAGLLHRLEKGVSSLEVSLSRQDVARGAAAADDLVAVTDELLGGLAEKPQPDADAEAELVAALRVYRNAAFAFRRLAGTAGARDPAIAGICASMIEQGHDHYRLYASLKERR